MRKMMLLGFAFFAMLAVSQADAQWNLCQNQLDCNGSFADLSCYGQCEADACSEAQATDWWYQFEYNQCFDEYDRCRMSGGTHEWCDYAVLTPCAQAVGEDHRDACDDIQSRRSACQAACWECSYC